MKPRRSNQTNQALTLIEALIVIAMLFVLACLLLPSLAGSRRSPRISCVNNLHQIGLTYRVWANDNNGEFPMEVSVTGSKEFVAAGKNAWLNYLVMSNELSTPKILICPADTDRLPPATNFSTELVGKISYFVGLDAKLTYPQMFLSGDDNFEVSGIPVKSGLLQLSTNAPISWTATRHKFNGNISLADGSVQQLSSNELHQAIEESSFATNRLAIP